MTKKIIFIILAVFAFSSCTDSWEENLTKNKIVRHEWLLYMYVDGVQNEMIELQDVRYNFEEDGDLVKTINDNEIINARWELIDKDYIKIGSAKLKINTITNKVMSLESGEDKIYFMPD